MTTVGEQMKLMGMLNVLCQCHVHVPEDEQDMIERAIADNLPDGWNVKRNFLRLELVPPSDGDAQTAADPRENKVLVSTVCLWIKEQASNASDNGYHELAQDLDVLVDDFKEEFKGEGA